MLKQAPLVTEALAVALGGDKFFTAYVPLLGMEVRVQVGGGAGQEGVGPELLPC
jgi:hypothetical protein